MRVPRRQLSQPPAESAQIEEVVATARRFAENLICPGAVRTPNALTDQSLIVSHGWSVSPASSLP